MSRVSIVALVAFVALTVLVLTMRTRAVQRLQARALEMVLPLHSRTNSVGQRLGALGHGLKSLEDLENENKTLTIENQQLRTRNQILNDLETENNGLRQALGFTKRTPFHLLPARIIARSATAWWSNVQIDRGEEDGLEEDMPVVSDVGLVGKTTTVAPHTASVLLITDENCKVAAYVEGTKEKGIVSGERAGPNVQPSLNLNYLSKSADLKPGQKVFSSGVSGGVFPYNLLLGTIKEFKVKDLAAYAVLSPAVDVSALENVFVVLPDRKGGKAAGDNNGGRDDHRGADITPDDHRAGPGPAVARNAPAGAAIPAPSPSRR